jgi:hypothetical protein
MTRRVWLGMLAAILVLGTATACGRVTAWRITGEWQSESLPKRTLILRRDGSYLQRFSGNTLGFLSEVFGPESGSWRIERHALVLTRTDAGGAETTRRLPIDGLSGDSLTLAGERWLRVH